MKPKEGEGKDRQRKKNEEEKRRVGKEEKGRDRGKRENKTQQSEKRRATTEKGPTGEDNEKTIGQMSGCKPGYWITGHTETQSNALSTTTPYKTKNKNSAQFQLKFRAPLNSERTFTRPPSKNDPVYT